MGAGSQIHPASTPALHMALATWAAVAVPLNLSGAATRVLGISLLSHDVSPHDGGSRPPIVVVSNRGPFSFDKLDDGTLVPSRAGGGLVNCLAPAVATSNATWIATAMTDGDREAARKGLTEAEGFQLRQVDIDPAVYRRYYDVISNGTLWFLHHNLFDLARRPRIDEHWWAAWHDYCKVNDVFADAIVECAPANSVVLVHDYHLALVGKALRDRRPDLATVHFHHTPFAGRDTLDVLPQSVGRTLLEGLAGFDACGFHSQRWAENFALCCAETLGSVPKTFVSAAAPNLDDLLQVRDSPECRSSLNELEVALGERKALVRVDRIELSKNLLRGFEAYDDLLRRYPQWREKVTFAAFIYPSREGLAEYLAYRNEVQGAVDRINAIWGTDTWTPVLLGTDDDFPRSVAALSRYDVLLVNPIRDGLNLVAKEGAAVNERNGVVVLSSAAGSWHELNNGALTINPFDVTGTADALVTALEMDDEERAVRAQALRDAVAKRSPNDWLDDQLRSVGR